jgi:chromosome segregation ATPase
MADTSNDAPAGAENTGGHQEVMIPKARFDEINERMKKAERELQAFMDKQTDAEKTRLAEQEEYRQLAERLAAENDALKPYKAQAEAAHAALQETVEGQIAQLSEDVRELVPTFADPRDTLAWLNKNAARLMKPLAPAMDAGAKGERKTIVNLTPGQEKAARDAHMTNEEYVEWAIKAGLISQ